MTCYDLTVDDFLPPRYHRVKRMWKEAKATFAAEKDALKLASKGPMDQRLADIYTTEDHNDRRIRIISVLEAILERYKRQAMRSYVKRVNAFLLPPDGVHRTIQKLRLHTFGRGWSVFIQRWIIATIGRWGVKDFELDVEEPGVSLNFRKILDGSQNVQLERLVLSNWYIYFLGVSEAHQTLLGLKNLLVDNCKFGKIYLDVLPCLETFVCRGQQPTKLYYGEVPQLRHVWIEPMALPSPLSHLRKLFIANVPMIWDIFWIVALLDAAPVLESCHVHIDNTSEKMASWVDVQAQERQYHCLNELVGWQIGFVKHVVKASPWLRRVHLLDGHVVEDDEQVQTLRSAAAARSLGQPLTIRSDGFRGDKCTMLPPSQEAYDVCTVTGASSSKRGSAAYEAEKAAYLAARRSATEETKERMQQWTRRTRPLLESIMRRYERCAKRCAMRRYVKRVDAFLLPPPDDGVRRTIRKLRLQTRSGSGRWSECIQRWVTAAIGRWGAEDLELDVEEHRVDYDFRVLDECQSMRLKRLVLINCKPIGIFDCLMLRWLTKLELCKASYYGGASRILSNCVSLVDFSIRHCRSSQPILQFSVPDSGFKKLLVDNCEFVEIYLDSLPWLETFACRGVQPTEVYYGEVPRLRHVSLDYLKTKVEPSAVSNTTYRLSKFVMSMPSIESLVLQFKGPEVWIEPIALPSPLLHLKKLFIANVPMNWDIFWIVLLLDAAPALEPCHVHIDNGSVKMASWLEVQAQQHLYHRLKDLTIVGFSAVGWQIGFVKHVMKASPRLRRVHLIDGHVVEDDDEQVIGGLEVVPHQREWHEFERSEVLDDLRDGIYSPQLEIILIDNVTYHRTTDLNKLPRSNSRFIRLQSLTPPPTDIHRIIAKGYKLPYLSRVQSAYQ
ncbi:Os03g0146900 [Oryza sativa Japonica Group]|uniref:Os03g0146900 protein n=1 Tax=Oryza sativa subsp. japonica TaxID=39947 RepID=C7J0M5_ORYSJ|nr:Os03g0146900 [Oryza sativa Japonica Group]|eukprot:NP_001173266.1 Os03g0146900 [Oryza sativa Japonica Group]